MPWPSPPWLPYTALDSVGVGLTRQEMFLEYFSDVLCKQATEDKRRTISYKDACTPFAGC